MDWLLSHFSRRDSHSPMAKPRRPGDSSSDEETDDGSKPSAFSSRITPWISSFVLKALTRPSSTSDNNHRPRMVEILERGGPFWDYDNHTSASDDDTSDIDDLPGWLLVTDGQYSIQIWLSPDCRSEIWRQISSTATRPMYAFLKYSRGHCGVLQEYSLKSFSTTSAAKCELECQSFLCQPQLQNMIVTNNTMIQSINECVRVRHALQSSHLLLLPESTSPTTQRGNVRDALGNAELMDAIMKQTEYNMEQEKRESAVAEAAAAAAASSAMKAPVDKEQSDESDNDDDLLPLMNISDMLATQEADEPYLQMKRPAQEEEEGEDLTGGLDDDDLMVLASSAVLLPPKKKKPRVMNWQRDPDDIPNLPLFTAFCKQLDDSAMDVIDIPGVKQPRAFFESRGFGMWLDDLGY
jgi:hypothetical protein